MDELYSAAGNAADPPYLAPDSGDAHALAEEAA